MDPPPRHQPDRAGELRRLTRLLEGLAGGTRAAAERFASGCPPLDRRLPQQGFVRGSLVEWLAEGSGSGATALAVLAAREAQGEDGAAVVIDRNYGFYPPAAAAWRLDLARTLVVHPASEADERWALDQSLRCEHVSAVLAWPRRLDDVTFRRLQLAAESSGAVGLLVRPATARGEPSWADVRLVASPCPAAQDGWRLRLEIVRCRGSSWGGGDSADRTLFLEINHLTGDVDETDPGSVAAELARAAPPRGTA